MSPGRRRRCIDHVMRKFDVSERLACRVLGQHRSTQRKAPKGRADDAALTADIVALGGVSHYLADNAAIIAVVKAGAKAGDVVAVLSNGGFGEIHKQLLDEL